MRLDEMQAGISGISIDTRTLIPGNLFIAIKGAQFDGHDFIETAIEKGAAAVLLSDRTINIPDSVPVFQVNDTVKALGELAAFHRAQFSVPVIGITGSNGKTTVKGMLGSIFSQIGSPLVTTGNFNNHIGLPLTLLKLTQQQDAAIIEMGASNPGDIRYLCDIAKPTITLVNNVMPAHLAGFGTLEGVAKTKGEIYEGLSEEGTAVLNLDLDIKFSDYFRKITNQIETRKMISFGLEETKKPDITAYHIVLENHASRFVLITPKGEISIVCPVPGQHNVLNALAASSVAYAAGVELSDIAKGLQQFSGLKGRLQSIKISTGAYLIDDSYNANPGSFAAAIEVLASAKAQGPTILVMGDMGELGDAACELHAQIGQLARDKGITRLLAVGPLSEQAVKAFGEGAEFYTNKQDLINVLRGLLTAGSTCLIKGSRSAKMETVVEVVEKVMHHLNDD